MDAHAWNLAIISLRNWTVLYHYVIHVCSYEKVKIITWAIHQCLYELSMTSRGCPNALLFYWSRLIYIYVISKFLWFIPIKVLSPLCIHLLHSSFLGSNPFAWLSLPSTTFWSVHDIFHSIHTLWALFYRKDAKIFSTPHLKIIKNNY